MPKTAKKPKKTAAKAKSKKVEAKITASGHFFGVVESTSKNTLASLKKNWLPVLILTIILAGSTFLRFYLLTSRLHFDIDEATHTETIYSIFKNHHLIIKGPPASGGTNLYHGAYYYYLFLLPAIITGGNPLGLAGFVSILSIASIYLLFKAIKNQYGLAAATVATLLYGVSYTVLLYSRWIWNPNVIPFFLALALFATSKLAQKQEKYLILFTFALSSITQVHVGGMFFIGVYILLLPYLIKITKNKWVWIWTAVAGLIPWIPTIVNELRHNFEFIRAFIELLNRPSHTAFITHITNGYNYFAFMFDTVDRLPYLLFVASLVAGFATLIYGLRKWRYAHSSIFPAFLLFSILLTFILCAYYPGQLFIHFAEQLFVIFPILIMFLLLPLVKNKITALAALVIIISSATVNFEWYQKDLLNGDHQYEVEKKICQTIKDQNPNSPVEITINGKVNPVYITYICENQYKIQFGTQVRYNFITDFKEKLDYSVN